MPAHLTTQRSRLEEHFPEALALRLGQALSAEDRLWVTDADGTLWRDDIGEAFLQRLIADGALVSPEAQCIDVWRSYEERVAADKAAGYAWAAQVMAGMPEAELNERADAFAREFVPQHVLPEMAALLDAARARGCPTWIVSASCRWIVSAAARVLELPVDRVLGIEVAVADGRLTTEVLPPVTYRQGKVQAISQRIRARPTLATGDSMGDVEMLQSATAGLLVVHPGKTDPALQSRALEEAWMMHVVQG